MTKPKIDHPYLVPDGFFDHMEEELMMRLDGITLQKNKRKVIYQVLKYAAIITVAVILGRQSVLIFPHRQKSDADQGSVTVDLVLSQVSDEDVTEFLMDNITQDVLNQ